MRGKETKKHIEFHVDRITPAYAGKSGAKPEWSGFLRDHPRLCGEKACESIFQLLHPGSPPPMRGKGFDRNEE